MFITIKWWRAKINQLKIKSGLWIDGCIDLSIPPTVSDFWDLLGRRGNHEIEMWTFRDIGNQQGQ